MYCKDHLFIERLVSSCCITVILIGCLNFMSFLSKDAGCSSSAKFERTFNLLHIYLLLSLAVMLPSKVSTSHTRRPGSSLYTQKPVVPVKFIFPLQLHHGWVAPIHPKAPETLSHSAKQSKCRAYWPTHDFGVHHLRAGSSPQLLSLPLRPAQKQQAHLILSPALCPTFTPFLDTLKHKNSVVLTFLKSFALALAKILRLVASLFPGDRNR